MSEENQADRNGSGQENSAWSAVRWTILNAIGGLVWLTSLFLVKGLNNDLASTFDKNANLASFFNTFLHGITYLSAGSYAFYVFITSTYLVLIYFVKHHHGNEK